jgi:hypothetical protein
MHRPELVPPLTDDELIGLYGKLAPATPATDPHELLVHRLLATIEQRDAILQVAHREIAAMSSDFAASRRMVDALTEEVTQLRRRPPPAPVMPTPPAPAATIDERISVDPALIMRWTEAVQAVRASGDAQAFADLLGLAQELRIRAIDLRRVIGGGS